MTTPNDDQNLQQQQSGTEGEGDAGDGWDLIDPDPADVAETPAGAGDGENKGDAEADEPANGEQPKADEKKVEAPVIDERKSLLDKYSVSKNEAETLRKAARKLEEEGLLDRKEMANAIGVKEEFLSAVLDKQDLPEPGDEGHIAHLQSRFKEDYENPVHQKALSRVYGDQNAQLEILQAFDFAVASSPELRDKYVNTAPDDVLYFAMDEGKAALVDFREAQAIGNTPRAMLAKIRELQAENAELKTLRQNVTTQAKDQTTEAAEEEPAPAPKNAREARLQAFLN